MKKTKVTTVSLTPERQELIEGIRRRVRIRGGGELLQATVIYAGLEALAELVRSGRSVAELPAMKFVGANQVLPSGEIHQAPMRTAELYDKCKGGLKSLRGFEDHAFAVDAELIEVGGWVKLRGLRFTPSLGGTSDGLRLVMTGPYKVQMIASRTATLAETLDKVHLFDLVRFYPPPKKCKSCDNLVTAGREPFEEELGDYCATCELANVVPLSTEDRMFLESNDLKQ